jgi:hypothetical protein
LVLTVTWMRVTVGSYAALGVPVSPPSRTRPRKVQTRRSHTASWLGGPARIVVTA